MFKKMFTGRKRVPFLSSNTRGDSTVESDDTEPKASCDSPTREEETRVKYKSECFYITKHYTGGYTILNDTNLKALSATQEELQCLKDMLNTMEELD